MSRTYTIPPQQLRNEERRALGAGLGFALGLPLGLGLVLLSFFPDAGTLTRHDLVVFGLTLILPGVALLLRARTLRSLRVELDDQRVTLSQRLPLTRSPRQISFSRGDVAHIREIRKDGLMICGRNSQGKYLDLRIPRILENYDDLRSRLAAWHPIQES